MKKYALIILFVMAPVSAPHIWVDYAPLVDFDNTDVVEPLNGNEGMMFGGAVALTSQYAVVAGMNADIERRARRNLRKAGEVVVYSRKNNAWVMTDALRASDASTNDNFGFSIDIDDTTVLVGSWRADVDGVHDAGAAYIFQKQADDSWLEIQRLTAPEPSQSADFGASVSISGDTILVGAQGQAVNGVENAGAAFLFKKSSEEQWILTQTLSDESPESGELFGRSVAVGNDEIFVGSPKSTVNDIRRVGAVHIFENDASLSQYSLTQSISPDVGSAADLFGEDIAYSNGSIAIGAWHDDTKGVNAGAVYVFDKTDNGWVQSTKLLASDGADDDRLGFRVDVWNDLVIAGAYKADSFTDTKEAGAAYVYRRVANRWVEVSKLLPDNDEGGHFGRAVALTDNHVLVGAELTGPGKAYFFRSDDVSP